MSGAASLAADAANRHVRRNRPSYAVTTVDGDGTSLRDDAWPSLRRSTFSLVDLLRRGNFIPTASVVFRNGLFGPLPPLYRVSFNVRDADALAEGADVRIAGIPVGRVLKVDTTATGAHVAGRRDGSLREHRNRRRGARRAARE